MQGMISRVHARLVRRLNATADMIGAARRFLVCRIAEKIENKSLLVTDLAGWLKRLQRFGGAG